MITNKRSLLGGLGLLLAVMALTGCPYTPPTDEELNAAYQSAVDDAAVAEPFEIKRNLTAITEDNEDLIWDTSKGEPRVLVVTWTSWTGYDALQGQEADMTRDVWITVAPEVKQFCRLHALTCPDMTLRLEQLLGLPPHNGKTRFVEIWVRPADLFRPSPDPEITDREASLDFPTAAGYLMVSEEYVTWFTDLMASSYGENGYPWTRLGYTYDWGNAFSEVGLSEFVIRAGARVGVDVSYENEAYFNAPLN